MRANTVDSKYYHGDTQIGGDANTVASILHALLKTGKAPAKLRDDLPVEVKRTRSGATRWLVCGVVVAMETKDKEGRK